jgi:hypothetical protein
MDHALQLFFSRETNSEVRWLQAERVLLFSEREREMKGQKIFLPEETRRLGDTEKGKKAQSLALSIHSH